MGTISLSYVCIMYVINKLVLYLFRAQWNMFGLSVDPSTPLPGIIDSTLYHQCLRKLSDFHDVSTAVLYETFLECEFPEHLCSESHFS